MEEEKKMQLEPIEELSKMDEKALLARLIIEQRIANDTLGRTRKNTATLTTMAWVIIIITFIVALIPEDKTIFEILD